MPTQNDGIDHSIKVAVPARRSVKEFCLTESNMPNGTPIR